MELIWQVVDLVAATPTHSPPAVVPGATSPPTPWVPLATLGAALMAAVVATLAASLQRRSGREAAAAAKKSAEGSRTSAASSQRSAKAAEDSVALTAATAQSAGLRADAKALSKRYQDAAGQLGHDKPAVRLAGIYAMSRLADDWVEQRQTCIDVLCAYLRMPWEAAPTEPLQYGEKQVRGSILVVINQHLADGAEPSWEANNFDFTAARFKDVRFDGCTFARHVTFAGAYFSGDCLLKDIVFGEGASFDRCAFAGRVHLDGVTSAGTPFVTFEAALVKGMHS